MRPLSLVLLIMTVPAFGTKKINVGKYFNLKNVDYEIDGLSDEEIARLHPDAGLSIDKFLEKYNYPFEIHTVTTEDGYILTIHRIPHGREELNLTKSGETRPPVLIMHGLLSNSFDFVNTSPGRALALVLADAGYDVWIGNNRGTKWSRKHLILDPDQNITFWDFSYHDLGYYDIPAFIDYILETTGATKVSYAGHSQGTTQFFSGMASRPEYNDKIAAMAALAPAVYLTHIPQPLLNMIKDYFDIIFAIGDALNLGELLPHFDKLYNFIGTYICGNEKYQWICEVGFFLGCGFDTDQWDTGFSPLIFLENDPSGSSWKEFKHYGQGITSGKFAQYDYGAINNLQKYNQTSPPSYNLSLVSAPVALFSGKNDWLVSQLDVDQLEAELPNVVLRHDVQHDNFTHIDFIWARDLYSLVNIYVLNFFNEFNEPK